MLRAKLGKAADPKKAQSVDRQLKRLVQAEPKKPKITGRIPIDIDVRCGSYELSEEAKEFKAWVRISTLEKRVRVAVPLVLHEFAEKTLDDGWKPKSFKIIYKQRLRRWEVHLAVEKTIEVQVTDVAGVDLGLKRLAVAYSVKEDRVICKVAKGTYKEFFHRLRELNNRYSRAQRLNLKALLKKLSHKRRNMVADLQRKLARRL
ncbi:MAG: transposase, partial [Candidatus Bathyarchaeota archaeon]|nr:transposase [Candidatus Bathyarchaeota archaeon]